VGKEPGSLTCRTVAAGLRGTPVTDEVAYLLAWCDSERAACVRSTGSTSTTSVAEECCLRAAAASASAQHMRGNLSDSGRYRPAAIAQRHQINLVFYIYRVLPYESVS